MTFSNYLDTALNEEKKVIEEASSLINIKHGKDQITMDLRTKQIRYLKDVANKGPITFITMSNTDVESYEYLYKEDIAAFKRALAEDIENFLGKKVNPNKMEIADKPEHKNESTETAQPIINEDDTGIPYMAMGGVFTKDVNNLSKFVDIQDRMQLQKALIDMFTLYPEVTDDMIVTLASNLKMEPAMLQNQVYAIMSSFFNRGKWVANPNAPIDPNELQAGIKEEMEHTDNILIAERIARDHLAGGDSMYYTHLAEMEARYQGKK